MSMDIAHDAVTDVTIFGTLLVKAGLADGMVSGAAHTTADTVRPALQLIRTTPESSVVSSVFMCLADKVLVYGDCAVNPDPDPEQLADIAISSAVTAKAFDRPVRRDAQLFHRRLRRGGDVEKVRKATDIVQSRRPDIPVEGPFNTTRRWTPMSPPPSFPDPTSPAKRLCWIFPDLNTGNNTYKAVQRSARAVAIIRARPAGTAQTGQRPPAAARSGHREHHHHHRHPGAGELMTTPILVLNSGSSSIKYELIDMDGPVSLAQGSSNGSARPPRGSNTMPEASPRDRSPAGRSSREARRHGGSLRCDHPVGDPAALVAVGHRVVHGGDRFAQPAVIDDEVLSAIRECIPLAPCTTRRT